MIINRKLTDSFIEMCFTPLVNEMKKRGCFLNWKNIHRELNHFEYVQLQNVSSNAVPIHYDNFIHLYKNKDLPCNVFWVSCLSLDPKKEDVHYPGQVSAEIEGVVDQLIANEYDLEHQLTLDVDGDLGLFFYFKKEENGKTFFNGFFILVEHYGGLLNGRYYTPYKA